MPTALTEAADPRARRRAAKREQILEAAWQLARRDGPAGMSLHELAQMVELRQPSLYNYFASKHDLYDAMFAQGFQALVDERRAMVLDPDPRLALRQGARHFVDFCLEDPARYQLLFQRPIPGFTPSDTSLAITVEALGYLQSWLSAAGLPEDSALDLLRPLLAGLAGEQIANDPGGNRWTLYLDELVDVFVEVMNRRRERGES